MLAEKLQTGELIFVVLWLQWTEIRFIEEKAGFGDFWTTVLNSNPVTSTLLNLMAAPGAIVPVSSAQGNAIGNYILNHNGKAGSCFTHKLTV